MKKINLYKELLSAQKEREEHRANLKLKMRSVLPNKISQIVFPKYHIPKNNYQLRHGLPYVYNGFIVYLPGLVMAVDPGVDFLYRMAVSNIFISEVNTIFISHSHVDHSISADFLIDWLIRKGSPVQTILPKNVIEDGSISKYHAGLTANTNGWKGNHYSTIITNQDSINLDASGQNMQIIPMYHGTPSFGFKISYKGKTIGYVSDTGYTKNFITTTGEYKVGTEDYAGEILSVLEKIDELKNNIADVNILIVNVENFTYEKNSKTHLTIFDLIDIVKGSKVEKIIIAHCNPFELSFNKWNKKLCQFVKLNTQIETILPGQDGFTLEL